MSEFGRSGPQLPHDEASQKEHLKEVEEDLHHEHEAERVAKAHPKRERPWWKFWAKASG
jgi:hypothetical protein